MIHALIIIGMLAMVCFSALITWLPFAMVSDVNRTRREEWKQLTDGEKWLVVAFAISALLLWIITGHSGYEMFHYYQGA